MSTVCPLFAGGTTGLMDGTIVKPPAYSASATYTVGRLVAYGAHAWACNTAIGTPEEWTSGHWDDLGAYATLTITETGTGGKVTAHFRTLNPDTLDDPGEDSTANVFVDAADNLNASVNGSTGWTASSLDLGVVATGGNQPVYVDLTAAETYEHGSTDTVVLSGTAGGELSFEAGSRLAQGGTITITPGDMQLSCALPAVSGADRLRVQYKAHADSTWIDAADVTDPSVITGLTNVTLYDVRYRGEDERGAGPWSATVSGTPNVASTTLYPAAGDGFVRLSGESLTTWALARDGATGSTAKGTDVTEDFVLADFSDTVHYGVGRGYMPVDMTSMHGTTFAGARVRVPFGYLIGSAPTLIACASTQGSTASLSTGDYNAVGATAFSSGVLVVDGTVTYIPLNATGLAAVQAAADASGYVKLAVREAHDFDNSAPASGTTYGMGTYYSERGTGDRLCLEVW